MEAGALPAIPLDQMANGPTASTSVAGTLRAEYQKAKARTSVNVRIPGYDALYGTFRAIRDYSELYDMLDPKAKQHLAEKQLTLEIAMDLIIESCKTAFADIGGERHEWPLGLALYDELFPPEGDEARPQTDREALVMLFPLGTASIVTLAQQLQLWQAGKMVAIDGELVGN